jgi:hypothetical protein
MLLLKKIGLIEHVSQQASGSTTSYKQHHDINKTIGNATYGLACSYWLHYYWQ